MNEYYRHYPAPHKAEAERTNAFKNKLVNRNGKKLGISSNTAAASVHQWNKLSPTICKTCVVVYFRRRRFMFALLGTLKVVHRGSLVGKPVVGAVLGYLCIWDTSALDWRG